MKSQGLDQREIAQRLQVSPTLISFDMKFMRKEALKNIGDYTTKELPLQFRIVIKALQNAIQTYYRKQKMTMIRLMQWNIILTHIKPYGVCY
jgi:hypothetical protein